MNRRILSFCLAFVVAQGVWATTNSDFAPRWVAFSGRSIPSQTLSVDSTPQRKSISESSIDAVTPEINELARNLHDDPVLIYEFVRNKIEYVPYYGFKKGAYQTLLDRAGNDADQSALLVALLSAADDSIELTYQYGILRIPTADASATDTAASWFGVDNTKDAVSRVIYKNALPLHEISDLWTDLDRIWIKATIQGTPHQLDPAFKPHHRQSPLEFTNLMGYVRSTLLTAAGGDSTDPATYARNLNEANVRQELADCTSNLVAEIRANYFGMSVADAFGNDKIIEVEVSSLPTSLPFQLMSEVFPFTTPPPGIVHTLRLQHGTIDKTFSMADIAGKCLSISYNPVGNEGGVEYNIALAYGIEYYEVKMTAFLGESISGYIILKNNNAAPMPINAFEVRGGGGGIFLWKIPAGEPWHQVRHGVAQ